MKKILLFSLPLFFLTAIGIHEINIASTKPKPADNNAYAIDKKGTNDILDIVRKHLEDENSIGLKVGTKFFHQMPKEKLLNAQTIYDILPDEITEDSISISEFRIGFHEVFKSIEYSAKGKTLSETQKLKLKKLRYTENYYVKAEAKRYDSTYAEYIDYELAYFVSVVPNINATYKGGNENLLAFLVQKSKSLYSTIDVKKLGSGRIYFTISSEGKIIASSIEGQSGNAGLDTLLSKHLNNAPENWQAAIDQNGKETAQELILFYGNSGC